MSGASAEIVVERAGVVEAQGRGWVRGSAPDAPEEAPFVVASARQAFAVVVAGLVAYEVYEVAWGLDWTWSTSEPARQRLGALLIEGGGTERPPRELWSWVLDFAEAREAGASLSAVWKQLEGHVGARVDDWQAAADDLRSIEGVIPLGRVLDRALNPDTE